ncbi:MAG: hypothetical protein ACHQDD_02340 [Steroidobacterales bacterium]
MTSGVTVWFGTLGPASGPWQPLSPRAWTCVGMLAIPLWATWPTLALRALALPAFECLTIAFAFGWLVLARLERSSVSARCCGCSNCGRDTSPDSSRALPARSS